MVDERRRERKRRVSIGARRQRRRRAARAGPARHRARPRDRPDLARTTRSTATSPPACRSTRRWRCARATPRTTSAAARRRWPSTCGAMLDLQRRGAVTFDYGNNIRAQAGEAGRRRRLRLSPASCPSLHPPAVLRGQGPVPLGRALRRPGGHHRTDQARARALPGRRRPRPLAPAGRASRSSSRACRRASAGSATASARRLGLRFNELVAQRRAEGADRHRPRSSRLRLGRLARTARPRR